MTAPLTLDVRHRRFIRTEMAISTTLSAVLPTTMMWLTYGPYPVPLWGGDGLALFAVKNSLGMGFFMTLLMTLATRMRIRKGGAPALSWSRAEHRWLRFVPGPLPVRAALYAIGVLALFAPVGILARHLLGLDPVGRVGFLVFNLLYGGAIGFALTPLILLGAMSDRAPDKPPVMARR